MEQTIIEKSKGHSTEDQINQFTDKLASKEKKTLSKDKKNVSELSVKCVLCDPNSGQGTPKTQKYFENQNFFDCLFQIELNNDDSVSNKFSK